MPQRAQNTPVCRDCDGFANVAITTGTRHRDGSRTTVIAACPACNGTGHTTRGVLARAGR
ncbi:hypothetical protein ACWCP6_07835 [Streptomyces sp. NPDC002004]